VIAKVVERDNPSEFFYFDADQYMPLPPLERFPPIKVGYSVCLWLKLQSVSAKEASLVSWQCGDETSVLEVVLTRGKAAVAGPCGMAVRIADRLFPLDELSIEEDTWYVTMML